MMDMVMRAVGVVAAAAVVGEDMDGLVVVEEVVGIGNGVVVVMEEEEEADGSFSSFPDFRFHDSMPSQMASTIA